MTDDCSRWETYFGESADALIVLDGQGTVLEFNEAACRLTGFGPEALKMSPVGVLFSAEELDRTPFRFDLLADGSVVRSSRMLRRADGTLIPVEMVTSPLSNRTLLSAFRDMSEVRRAQEALRLSEEKFSKAFRTSPDAINLTRISDGTYVDVNEGFTRMTGWTAAEVVGRRSLPGDLGVWDRAEDRDNVVRLLADRGEVRGYEARFRRKDGGIVIGSMSARRIDIDSEPCLLSVTRDVTELRRTEEALRRAQKLEALGVLAGGIAHDFNNLLTGVFGHLELARALVPGTSALGDHLDSALTAFDRAKALTLQLLTFARGGAPVKRSVDLGGLIAQTVRFTLAGSGVRAQLDMEEPLLPCEADANQIVQVLENLILNARQAMPKGGTITVRAEGLGPDDPVPPPLEPGRYLKVEVADEGCGIPAENLSKVFDPFFTTKAEGTGLGLATSYSIIQRHGGVLEAESQEGEGSRFRFYLPAGTEAPPAVPRTEPGGAVTGLTILYLDDEPLLREIAVALLAHRGHRVTPVATGADAVRLYGQALGTGQPFDLVLLDLTLPGGEGGLEVLTRLQERDPGVRAVATSGYSVDPVMAEPTRFGFLASLPKPFLDRDFEDLLGRIRCRLPARGRQC